MTGGQDDAGAAPEIEHAARRQMRLTGVHHLTLICADLDRTTAFYRDVLGMAVIRETVNDDDPGTRHHWFSTAPGDPSQTVVSFLEYPAMAPATQGTGGTHHIALGVGSAAEVAAWRAYLQGRDIPTTDALDRGGLRSVYLRDPDGHILEITAASTT